MGNVFGSADADMNNIADMNQCVTELAELVATKATACEQTKEEHLHFMFDQMFANEWSSTIHTFFALNQKKQNIAHALHDYMEWFPDYAPNLELFIPIFQSVSTFKNKKNETQNGDNNGDMKDMEIIKTIWTIRSTDELTTRSTDELTTRVRNEEQDLADTISNLRQRVGRLVTIVLTDTTSKHVHHHYPSMLLLYLIIMAFFD